MKRAMSLFVLCACCICIFAGVAGATEITNPILKKLVEKGILTREEALSVMEELKGEAVKKELTTGAVSNEQVEKVEQKVDKVAKDVEEIKKDAEKTTAAAGIFKGMSIGVKGYFEYRSGDGADNPGSGLSRNTFRVTRAYLDVKKQLTDNLLARWTSDYETQAAKGDANVYMKYLYLQYRLPVPVETSITAGIISAPYIAYYEDEWWPYRMRGKIPQENFKVLDASADMGVLLGGKVKVSNEDMFSYALGVMNNQHYRVNDNNENKAVEGRLSIRPLATTGIDYLKGLELTYFGIRGKDGTEADKGTKNYGDHKNDTLLAGYKYEGLTLGYEYYKATRFGGTKSITNSLVYDKSKDDKTPGAGKNLFYDGVTGQTLFGVYRIPVGSLKPVRVFGEYALLDDIKVGAATKPKDGRIRSSLGGVSYDIYKDKTIVAVDYNQVNYKNIGTAVDDKIWQAVLQIAY